MIKHSTACGAWREIELDGTNLRIPEGAALDFGGIAKGWTVDRAVGKLPSLRWAIVNAGGDLRVVGTPPRAGLEIGIEDPHDADVEALRVGLFAGALATTSVTVRAWGQGNHHVIDPRTSLPAMTEVVQATVWGETCADAEVWSKAALLRGPAILDRVYASLVLASGEVVTGRQPAGKAMGGRQQQLESQAGRHQAGKEGRARPSMGKPAGREQARQSRVVPIRGEHHKGREGAGKKRKAS
jgi:thiamine biosynthesis lipoprotein ApbE